QRPLELAEAPLHVLPLRLEGLGRLPLLLGRLEPALAVVGELLLVGLRLVLLGRLQVSLLPALDRLALVAQPAPLRLEVRELLLGSFEGRLCLGDLGPAVLLDLGEL